MNFSFLFILFSTSIMHCISKSETNGDKADGVHPINILVLLPITTQIASQNPFNITLKQARPVFDEALDEIYNSRKLLAPGTLVMHYEDSFHSEIAGPNMAIKYNTEKRRVDCIIGFANDHALAPVARMSPFWKNGIPVITTIGLQSELDNKQRYPLLTRVVSPYKVLRQAVFAFADKFGWHNESAVYFFSTPAANPDRNHGPIPIHFGECHSIMRAIGAPSQTQHNRAYNVFMFDEQLPYEEEHIRGDLERAATVGKVIYLCASPHVVRNIMLTAHQLGMTTSNGFVFVDLNISLQNTVDNEIGTERPWNERSANYEQNSETIKVYENLKMIRLAPEEDMHFAQNYAHFKMAVVKRALNDYNDSTIYGNMLNRHVTALADALLLFATALNETLINSRIEPEIGHNGLDISKQMWNRTFTGILGNQITMDGNGDRFSAYSIYTIDPTGQKFMRADTFATP